MKKHGVFCQALAIYEAAKESFVPKEVEAYEKLKANIAIEYTVHKTLSNLGISVAERVAYLKQHKESLQTFSEGLHLKTKPARQSALTEFANLISLSVQKKS